jgi:hypothetical protein
MRDLGFDLSLTEAGERLAANINEQVANA